MLIPKERIGVLIGKNGETKRKIQKVTQTEITIDSKTGQVIIKPQNQQGAINMLTVKSIVTAIARGFSPEKAMKLLNEEIILEIIDLETQIGKSRNTLTRIKGRIIGKNGKTRQAIEQYTSTHLSIYGKTVSIIGDYQDVLDAKKAIQLIINGASHGAVYAYLEKKAREKQAKEMRTFKISDKI